MTANSSVAADPAELTPDERLRQIATILARGVLRLRRRRAAGTAPESGSPSLDVSAETVLSVTSG